MSSSSQAVANVTAEDFPDYKGSLHYIQGYDPVSYEAPHSSLHRTTTWVGMGVALATLFFLGMMLWAGAIAAFGNSGLADINWQLGMIIGAIGAAACIIISTILIKKGRSAYKAYSRATGRMN